METFEFLVTSTVQATLYEHIKIQALNYEDAVTRICRREILQLLQNVITNNNLFHLKRKWNKLMIKEPSASES